MDDEAGDGLRVGRYAQGGLEFVGGHSPIAVAVDDVEQPTAHRPFVRLVGHRAAALPLFLAEQARGLEEVSQAVLGRIVVVDNVEAIPGPGADPGRDAHLFAHPAVQQVAVGVVEQAVEVVPVVGFAMVLLRDLDFPVGRQGIQQTPGHLQISAAGRVLPEHIGQPRSAETDLVRDHRRALGELQPGPLGSRQALGPQAAGLEEGVHVIAGEHFQVELVLRRGFVGLLVGPEVADQVARLDSQGQAEHHHLVAGHGRAVALQPLDIDVLVDALQFAELAFALVAEDDFRATAQFEQHLVMACVGFGTDIQAVAGNAVSRACNGRQIVG
ncbi:hypothetical protein D9M68_560620 [compost metagenome]